MNGATDAVVARKVSRLSRRVNCAAAARCTVRCKTPCRTLATYFRAGVENRNQRSESQSFAGRADFRKAFAPAEDFPERFRFFIYFAQQKDLRENNAPGPDRNEEENARTTLRDRGRLAENLDQIELDSKFVSSNKKVNPSPLKDQPSMAYNAPSMLRFLRVRNFALIDQLELHFNTGFNLLSGETGAGKSIIVDALGLLAGAKASAEMIRTGETAPSSKPSSKRTSTPSLDRLGLDAEGDEVIIRREISSDERNRVYINNQPSTVSALRELAPALLDIHGQHEQQTLLDQFQPACIDRRLRRFHGTRCKSPRPCSLSPAERRSGTGRIDGRTRPQSRTARSSDVPARRNPKGESEDRRNRRCPTEDSMSCPTPANFWMPLLADTRPSTNPKLPSLSSVAQTQRAFRDAAQHDPRLQPIAEQMETARISIQDIAYALRDYADQVDADPQELERLQSRLAELERLHRKYGPDLLDHLHKVRREMDSIGLTEIKKRRAPGQNYRPPSGILPTRPLNSARNGGPLRRNWKRPLRGN